MKLRPLVMGIALSAIAAVAAARDGGVEGASGRGPTIGSEGNPAAPAVKTLNSRQGYWTAERYRDAKPMPLPAGGEALPQTMLDETADSPQEHGVARERPDGSRPGQPPLLDQPERELLEKRLYVPDNSRSNGPAPDVGAAKSAGVLARRLTGTSAVPFDVGFRRAHFSSQSLLPPSADHEYPYSTTGRLFFRIPGDGDFVCSGSVISSRLVLTAGHCVHSGSGDEKGWFTDFEFVPAYRDGVAPFSTWQGSSAFVATPWFNGKGLVPNAADYALIEVEDQVIGGVSRNIGEVVGQLGYQTDSLIPNHAHLLGYPVDFDGGEIMHQVTAQSYRKNTRYNTVLYGSDMKEGSSGGPWIMNFGPTAIGQTGADNSGRNRVIGVTSYGYEGLPIQGSSTLDGNFTSMLDSACAHRDGNCQ